MAAVTVRVAEDKLLVGTDSNGHSIVIGKAPGDGSNFIGIKPSDLLLLAAASCSVYDIVDILTKQREPLAGLTVDCTGDQESDPPYTFKMIHLHYRVRGRVNAKKLERAIELSEQKYCSVLASLRPEIPISSDYQIFDEE
jgi:putative redox protein